MEDICYVAEFTTNPMGNLNLLMRMTEKAAEAGCTLIKMQKKDVRTFYKPEKLAMKYDSPYGKTYGDYRELFEFSEEDFERFDKKCKEVGIGWFSTVQDIPSLAFLLKFDLPIYKIASTNIRNEDLLRAFVSSVPKTKEIVISTAGATTEEIDHAVEMLAGYRHLTILHCVAEYPCSYEDLKLGNIPELIRRYQSPSVDIGYSGHEEGYIPTLAAVALGAKMVERHFCVSRHSFVHHIECSLEPDEYKEMIGLISAAPSRDSLKKYIKELPLEAMKCNFGMSDLEKEFLVNQKYGHKFIRGKAEIRDS